MKSKWILLAGIFTLVASGYLIVLQFSAPAGMDAQTTLVEPAVEDILVGISNPAAVYCTELGNQYELKKDPLTGQETGICTLPDNSACDEWDFLAGKCGRDHSFCAKHGYKTQVKKDGRDPFSAEYAECIDQDGKTVGNVTKLFKLEEKIKKSGCKSDLPDSLPAELSGKDKSKPIGSPLENISVAPGNSSAAGPVQAENLPASFDWRSAGAGHVNWLTPVRNQAGCGSCWAFAAVGVAEAAHNIANSNPNLDLDLAEQYLVSDCSGAGTCCGGYPHAALNYIQASGIPDEGCLPYADSGCGCTDGVCSAICIYKTGGRCSNRTCADRCSNFSSRLVRLNEIGGVNANAEAMKQAVVERGPIMITIRMSGAFDGDVYRCNPDNETNHAVVVVGYDDAGGYWIVRNSWGASWNGDGYFKLGYGECSAELDPMYGILYPATLPVISSLTPSSIEPGSSGFTLTVNGSNFVSGSKVRWNGSSRTTTFVSSSRLTAAISAADVATAATIPVTVFNPLPGGGISNAVNFTVRKSCPSVINGWKGEYWNNWTWTGDPLICRDDANLDFNWYGDSPDPMIPPDYFSARWTKTVPFQAGPYNFTIYHDDGARLMIDGNVIYENLCYPDNCMINETITYTPGQGSHTVVMQMRENWGYSGASLSWAHVINPDPEITSLSPSSTPAGGTDFTLTVNGMNFVNGSVVNWDSTPLTTTFISLTRLEARITASYIEEAGYFPITVSYPGGITPSVDFVVDNPLVEYWLYLPILNKDQ